MVSETGKSEATDMEIICLGDSLTYGYGVRRSQCWTELAARESGWTLRN